MSGNKCMYINCGKSRYNSPGLKMYSFPIHDIQRSKKWILNAGKSPSDVILFIKFCRQIQSRHSIDEERILVYIL